MTPNNNSNIRYKISKITTNVRNEIQLLSLDSLYQYIEL